MVLVSAVLATGSRMSTELELKGMPVHAGSSVSIKAGFEGGVTRVVRAARAFDDIYRR